MKFQVLHEAGERNPVPVIRQHYRPHGNRDDQNMILALGRRYSDDPRSLSQVFWHCCDEVADKDFAYALDIILEALHHFLHENVSLPESEICDLIDLFVSKIASCFKRNLIKNKHFAIAV